MQKETIWLPLHTELLLQERPYSQRKQILSFKSSTYFGWDLYKRTQFQCPRVASRAACKQRWINLKISSIELERALKCKIDYLTLFCMDPLCFYFFFQWHVQNAPKNSNLIIVTKYLPHNLWDCSSVCLSFVCISHLLCIKMLLLSD